MVELIEKLQNLNSYRFSLQGYKINHSEMLLSAVNPDDTSLRFNIGFADVHYVQMPVSWIGSFVIGSDRGRRNNKQNWVAHRWLCIRSQFVYVTSE